ncbi:helix-turn-helix domain-containing protein [Melaminivora alkalimesophila]|uniref:Helix-turn-helix protein n=1 Tax=Melaminivora alkalimesophila TaxID=1165852 RepID=A0A317RCZ7_9BURK|nr:helix-turn-helix domain-containing protein [Melaminivora alkalimesophila]PWW47734.1 helix-turn-helix protein [Melaminivora alkalimesophila]
MILRHSKQKAPGATNTEGFQNVTSKRRHFSKSTATEAQYQRIIEALRRRPHTSYELMTIAGVYHPPSRIFELKAKGFLIDKTTVTVVDRDGYSHTGVALYSLVAEPENADALIGSV